MSRNAFSGNRMSDRGSVRSFSVGNNELSGNIVAGSKDMCNKLGIVIQINIIISA